MFTRGTRHFGIWRDQHTSRRRYAGRPTTHFVLSLAAAAFVSTLFFFITWKVRGDFFLIETSQVELARVPAPPSWLFSSRPAAMTLAVLPTADGLELIFDRGESFRIPEEREKLTTYLRGRMESIEFQAMLAMHVEKSMGRVQLWPHKTVDSAALGQVLGIFTREGFDDFDVAVTAEEHRL